MLDIGLEVKILRERMKMSAKELAERIGLSQSQMSRLEKGQRRIDTGILAKIADALEVDPSYFFRGESVPETGVIPPSDPGDVGQRIRSERRKLHLSAEDLAAKIGSTKASLRAIEEGRRELEPELADRIARALKLPHHFFLSEQRATIQRLEAQVSRLQLALAEDHRGRAGIDDGESDASASSGRRVPVLGTLAGGYPSVFDDEGEPAGEADDFLSVPGLVDAYAFAFPVVGDSMESESSPSFGEGDWVVFTRGAVRSRDFAFVRLADQSPAFRQVYYDPGGRVRLQPLNLHYAALSVPRDAILGMWRLVGHLRSY